MHFIEQGKESHMEYFDIVDEQGNPTGQTFPIRVSIVLNPWRIQAAERGFNIQMSVNLTTLNSQ